MKHKARVKGGGELLQEDLVLLRAARRLDIMGRENCTDARGGIYNIQNRLVSATFAVNRGRGVDLGIKTQSAVAGNMSLLVTARAIEAFLERASGDIVG